MCHSLLLLFFSNCSPSDIGKAFTKLLKDNRREAVLMVRPGEDSAVQMTYVEQKWSEENDGAA